MIAELSIVTLLLAMVRQSMDQTLSHEEIAQHLWVLWDRQVECGSPFAPDGAVPARQCKGFPELPPGWTWDYWRWDEVATPTRLFESEASLSSMLRRTLAYPTRSEAESQSVVIHLENGEHAAVRHPGWSRDATTKVELSMLRAMLEEMAAIDPRTATSALQDLEDLETAYRKGPSAVRASYDRIFDHAANEGWTALSSILYTICLVTRHRLDVHNYAIPDILTLWAGVRQGRVINLSLVNRSVAYQRAAWESTGVWQELISRVQRNLMEVEMACP